MTLNWSIIKLVYLIYYLKKMLNTLFKLKYVIYFYSDTINKYRVIITKVED